MPEPHYVRGYRRFVAGLSRRYDEDKAAALAVGGGDYETHGRILQHLLSGIGLKSGDLLVDVGCGSGRLSSALSRSQVSVRYLGTDVVPELLSYARRRTDGENFRFVAVDGLAIPLENDQADMVTFFSVLTHLDRDEQIAYLQEAKRVLKRGGLIVCSYIDLKSWPILRRIRFYFSKLNYLLFRRAFKSVGSSESEMRKHAESLQLECSFLGPVIGQSVCVFSYAKF